ncbi:MAG: nucleotidyl transferase AbiEii/AbiGii toxin family protein [Gemmataceae bacterium]|nr:nucleotidyl transferase AbiEii/AbiGii toxin family protein [Gemmataceae bacterium]
MAPDVVLQTLKHAWMSLEPLRLPMALMGGLSVALWRHPRATRDVDLLVDFGPLPIATLLEALQGKGLRARRQPPLLQVGPFRILQLQYEPPGSFLELQVDLLFADSEYQRQALARRVPAGLPGLDLEIFVLSCEDLILHKLLAGRLLDRADVVALLRANKATLDYPYLQGWIDRLGLTVEWSPIWSEAVATDPPAGMS